MSEVVRKLTALNQAAHAMNSVVDLDRLFNIILLLMEDIFSLDSSALLLFDSREEKLRIHASRGLEPGIVKSFYVSPRQGMIGSVFAKANPILVDDATCENAKGILNSGSEMAAPLCVNNETIGVLDAESRVPHTFQEADLDLFVIFANQAATAISNVRLIKKLGEQTHELKQRVNELMLLNQLGQQMNSTLSLESLFNQVLRLAQEALHFDNCAVLLKEKKSDDDKEGVLVIRASIGYRQETTGMNIQAGKGITGLVFKKGESMLVSDVKANKRYVEGVSGGRCEMAAPLIIQGETIGVLDAESRVPGAFSTHDLSIFSTFASWVAIALHNAYLHYQLEIKQLKLRDQVEQTRAMNNQLHEYAKRINATNRDLCQRVKELETLQQTSQIISSNHNVSKILAAISRMTHKIMDSSACAVRLLNKEEKKGDTYEETYYNIIRSLAQALDARDANGHSERVTQYSLIMAKRLHLSENECRVLRYAAMLHDIGKIGISETILNKPLQLTGDEWKTICNHPLFGDTILQPFRFLADAQKIILHHHEHYDGSGYPFRLRGEEISLESRIIGLAEAYDAMMSDRPYRRAMSHSQAVQEIKRSSGTQFDPQVVEAFLSTIGKTKE